MSVPIMTFNHETWHEPRIPYHDIIEGQRSQSTHQDTDAATYKKAITASQKITGILTRTVAASPIIRYVIPATLWDREHCRDTIFVGETFFSIKAFVSDVANAGHLEDVITKYDFNGTRIMSAKVLGAPSNATLEEAPSDNEDNMLAKGWPSNVLVLALSSCEILFIKGAHRDGPRSTFSTMSKALPSNISRLERYGQFMAVDPLSRCMAISAPQNFFGIMILKPYDEIESSREKGKMELISEERYFRIDGTILAMEFLCPPRRLSDTAILALLVFRDGHVLTHHIYTFRLDQGLSMIARTTRELTTYPTGYYDPAPAPPIPIMMIPVTLPASYILATPMKAVLYKDVLSESPPIANELVPPNSRWVAWARPHRMGKWNTRHDDVYVCSDDGQLLFLSIDRLGDFTITPVDTIGTTLDTAFGILDVGEEKQDGDILVTAGSMGEGALFIAPARSSIKVVQRLPNWGPVCDCLMIPSKLPEIRYTGISYEPQPRNRLFTCASNGDCRGSLTEIRHGVEAKIGFEIECGEMYPRNVFILPELGVAAQGIYMMITELVGSTLLYISATGDEARVVEEEESGLDLKAETITAGVTAGGILMHVTENEIRMTRMKEGEKPGLHYAEPRIIAASICLGESVAFAMRDDATGTVVVEVREVVVGYDTLTLNEPIVGPLTLKWEPVSIAAEYICERLWLFMGTTDGRLMITSSDRLDNWMEVAVKPPGEDDANVVESIKVVKPHTFDSQIIVLCGLRCGWIVPFQLEASTAIDLNITGLDPWKFGETSAQLGGFEQNQTFAIVTCGTKIWRMEWLMLEKDKPTFVVEPIWVTDQNNPAFECPPVFASALISIGRYAGAPNAMLDGSLVVCTADHLMVCNMSATSKIVPRTVFLPGSPEKMIYSPRLNRIVVASSVRERKLDAGHVLSWTRPQVDFLDPDTTEAFCFEVQSDEASHTFAESEVPKLRGAAGEKVTALLEWTFKFGEMSYTFVVLATQTPFVSDKEGRLRGYLHFLRARFSPKHSKEVESIAKHRLAFEQPVRCCHPYGDSGLLVSYGKVVRLVVLDQQTRHFLPGPEFALESEAVSVSEENGLIYIMTSRSSLLVLAEHGQGSGQLRLLAQAGCDKAGLDHILFGNLPIILSSHRGGNVIGYAKRERYHPVYKMVNSVFAANLASSVRYFRDLPPAYSKTQACGVALDGTVFRFTALDERQWRLLKFLQNLYTTDTATSPRGSRQTDLLSDSIGKKENLHVDGDTLSKLVDKGTDYLRSKVGSPASTRDGDSIMSDDSDVHRLARRFEELAGPLFPDPKDTDLYRTVMAWVRDLVQVR